MYYNSNKISFVSPFFKFLKKTYFKILLYVPLKRILNKLVFVSLVIVFYTQILRINLIRLGSLPFNLFKQCYLKLSEWKRLEEWCYDAIQNSNKGLACRGFIYWTLRGIIALASETSLEGSLILNCRLVYKPYRRFMLAWWSLNIINMVLNELDLAWIKLKVDFAKFIYLWNV